MTGSMVMAPARSARVAMQHAGTFHRNVRGKIIAVMVALALAWCGFGALTAQRAQSDTGGHAGDQLYRAAGGYALVICFGYHACWS